MANHAVHAQLPIMVRKPKAVWPGLVKMGMYQKEIAGDGNCLFASLSDQLYGTPTKHPEIRSSIIEHMRTYRPLFEHYVHKDDVQQRRALRERTLAARRPAVDDAFEEYLALMSRNGTYGGEPELVAFCQVFDQDVTVHLPIVQSEERDSITYKNEQRQATSSVKPLHICYGGDEIKHAHYDSARSRDTRKQSSNLSERRRSHAGLITHLHSPYASDHLNVRSKRHSKSDLTSEQIHDFLQKGRRELEGSFDQLVTKDRARSSSMSSSHRSSSSKRSLEDDGEQSRTTKRADRRKSMKTRAKMAIHPLDYDPNVAFKLRIDSPGPDTPASTQDTEYSSDQAENNEVGSNGDDEYHDGGKAEDSTDTDESLDRAMAAMKAQPPPQRKRAGIAGQHIVSSVRGTSVRAGLTTGSE